MSLLYYKVNDKKFFNPYLAHYEEYKTGQQLTFHCNDELYDLYDWSVEPSESFELLMDIHAIRLRQQYKYIILNWSGGTDSHTIYNVFKRNNIHIDEICVKYTATEFFPKRNADWIVANHWDKSTKITVIYDEHDEHRNVVISNQDWTFDNTGDFRRYGVSGVDAGNILAMKNIHGENGWAIIAGFEKPKVYKFQDRWYCAMPDYSLRAALGHSNLECFFLEPKIHMKQCHLLKNFIKNNPSKESNPYTYEYYTEARATGRHEELFGGVSQGQKEINKANHKSTLITGDTSNFISTDPYLTEKLKLGDPRAKMYLKGLYNLRQERDFWEHMNTVSFTHQDAVFSMKPIWSKSYDLGM